MDFARFKVGDNAEEGRFWHIPDLQTGLPLYQKVEGEDGKVAEEPVGIWLRGIESATVTQAIREHQKRVASGRSLQDGENDAIARALVVRFQNVERDKRPLEVTPDDLDWFFGLTNRFVVGAINFASDAGNFISAE